jgi:hypothetical protein
MQEQRFVAGEHTTSINIQLAAFVQRVSIAHLQVRPVVAMQQGTCPLFVCPALSAAAVHSIRGSQPRYALIPALVTFINFWLTV